MNCSKTSCLKARTFTNTGFNGELSKRLLSCMLQYLKTPDNNLVVESRFNTIKQAAGRRMSIGFLYSQSLIEILRSKVCDSI